MGTQKYLPDEWFREEARRVYGRDGELEIDDGAVVSRNDEPIGYDEGADVQAWVWVENQIVREEEDDATSEEEVGAS